MLETIITLLGIGTLAAGAYAIDVWAHKDCTATRCAVCLDVAA
jgi:hypothetical protein